ncbi:MAG: 1-acyl-sn-glycerol-3-phosphate acyltransferase [Alphaproteobacteria bacterium]
MSKASSTRMRCRTARIHDHIVDRLIAERGQRLVNSPFWPLVKPLLYRILHYREAVTMADALASLTGQRALDYTSGILDLDIQASGLDRIPCSGAFILAASHPTGIADGVAVFDALKTIRRDLAIFCNRDALRVSPDLDDVLIPVEWRDHLRTRSKTKETVRLTARAFNEGRAIIMFPAGRIAYWQNSHLNERDWQQSLVTLARRRQVPIVPVHVRARNSGLFYWFANWNKELRDMTVFHELLNKRGKTFELTVGKPIGVDRLVGEAADITRALQHHSVIRLAEDADAEYGAASDRP